MTIDSTIIENFKKEFPEIYQINLENNKSFIYRPINRSEYNGLLQQSLDQSEIEEAVCNLCVLYPEYDFSKGNAGVAENVANHIIESSDLLNGQMNQKLIQYREEMLLFDYQIDCIIHEAFPEFSIEEIQNWTINKLMYYLSRAEFILVNLRGVPLEYQDNTQDTQNLQNNHYDHSFQSSPPQQSINHFEEDEGLRLIAENENRNGRNIITTDNNIDDLPEFKWFESEEQIKGTYE